MRKTIAYIITIILSLFVGASGMYLMVKYLPEQTDNVFRDTKDVKITEADSIYESVDKVYDAVVVVETSRGAQKIGSGTGFIYKVDSNYGYLITNNHVVENGDKYSVIFSNEKISEATVLGRDEFADLAVLRIPKDNITNIANLGKSSDVRLGDTVFTIGAPVGNEYMGTVTKGIISGKDRMVSVKLSNQGDYIMNVMQTDAAINPGNSGGPLVNINGDVIGINSLKLVEQEIEGIGFAIPIDDAMTYVKKLEKGERIVRPMLGVTLIDKSETYSLYSYGISLDNSSPDGVVIGEISSDSPAYRAGLKKGDIVTKIGDYDITSRAKLRYYLYKHNVGDTIKMTYYRDKKDVTVSVVLDRELK